MAGLNGTNLAALVVPFTTEDNYATHDSKYGKGGWHEVATISDRDAIPSDRLSEGMAVYVTGVDKLYIRKNNAWVEFESGSGVSDYEDLTNKPQINSVELSGDMSAEDLGLATPDDIPSVIDNVSSTSSTDALSAKQGKELNDRINNINIGRFLSFWDCTTGMPLSNPSGYPYQYTTSDYFIVSKVGTTNYMPNGSSYTGQPSTTVFAGEVKVEDIFRYDGTQWLLTATPIQQGTVLDVQKNGTTVVVDGIANVIVPTKTSDITNDSGFQNSTQVSSIASGLIDTHNEDNSAHSDIRNSIPTKTSDLTNDEGFIKGINSGMVITALGYTPYNATNPNGFISGIDSQDVTDALGYTPYDNTNPSGYQTSSQVGTAISNHDTSTTAHNDIRQLIAAKYTKPTGGIPKTDLASAVQTSLGKADSAYQKPSTGIPKTDLASAIQTSLGKADSAYQKPSTGIPKTDLTTDVQTSLTKADNALPSSQSFATVNGTSVKGANTITVQPTLVSGTNIKTINNTSILGSGNITVSGEPDAYIKSASVSGNTLTLTKKDDTTVTYSAAIEVLVSANL